MEGRSHERSHQVCDDHRRGALGHAHERLIYGLGSYERAKRRASVGETDQQRASVCEGCRSMPPLTYIYLYNVPPRFWRPSARCGLSHSVGAHAGVLRDIVRCSRLVLAKIFATQSCNVLIFLGFKAINLQPDP